MVAVDSVGKRSHFTETVTTVTAAGAANLYLRNVWKLHGLPRKVVSNHAAFVRGTPYASDDRPSSASASDSRLPSAPATSSLFRNAFGRMTSYATRSRPASAPNRMMSRDVA